MVVRPQPLYGTQRKVHTYMETMSKSNQASSPSQGRSNHVI